MKWQPIETAPKDGTSIVLWCATSQTIIHEAKWWRSKWCERNEDVDERTNWVRLDGYDVPTHWLKIEPPTT